MSRIIDVSLGIGNDLLTWPGDPGVSVERAKLLERGDPANVSEIHMGSHTGTHVDPPVHFIDGADPVDRLDLEVFYGEAVVADLRDADEVGPKELEALELPGEVERLLCRTRNSDLWTQARPSFPKDYVAVSPDGARWIVDRELKLVGVDFLSVEKTVGPDHPVHKTLLGGGTIIVEGLNLSRVEPGTYKFVCLPLKVMGGDGAPARAALIVE